MKTISKRRAVKRVRPLMAGGVVALCAVFVAVSDAIAAEPRELSQVLAELEGLSAQVDRLEGARAVRKLQRAYGYYVDRGLWSEAADLFSTDGTIKIGLDGVYVGPERIREYLQRLGGGHAGLIYGQLNEHLQLQPEVDVAPDALTAKARWRDLAMLGQFQRSAAWGDGIYEDTYVRESGVWKIKSLHLYSNFVAPYEKGWARQGPAPADWRSEASRAFPPDRPPSAHYRPFPELQVPPFHYVNPVSGRAYTGSTGVTR